MILRPSLQAFFGALVSFLRKPPQQAPCGQNSPSIKITEQNLSNTSLTSHFTIACFVAVLQNFQNHAHLQIYGKTRTDTSVHNHAGNFEDGIDDELPAKVPKLVLTKKGKPCSKAEQKTSDVPHRTMVTHKTGDPQDR